MAKSLTKSNKKSEIINLRDKTEVIATGKGKHDKGEIIVCHPKVAEYFVKHGVATEKGKKASEAPSA